MLLLCWSRKMSKDQRGWTGWSSWIPISWRVSNRPYWTMCPQRYHSKWNEVSRGPTWKTSKYFIAPFCLSHAKAAVMGWHLNGNSYICSCDSFIGIWSKRCLPVCHSQVLWCGWWSCSGLHAWNFTWSDQTAPEPVVRTGTVELVWV